MYLLMEIFESPWKRQKNLFHISLNFLILFAFFHSCVVAFLMAFHFELIIILFFSYFLRLYYLFFSFLIIYTECLFADLPFNYHHFTLVLHRLYQTIKKKFFFFSFLSNHFFRFPSVPLSTIGSLIRFFGYIP